MITHGRIERLQRGLSKWLVRLVPLTVLGGHKCSLALERIGIDDGSWTVPQNVLPPGAVCYCFGVGCDASFDIALAERSSVQIHSFDPTPSSIEYMNCHPEWPISFHPWGIWVKDSVGALYFQDRTDETNLSLLNPGSHRGGKQADVELCSLSTILQRLGHESVELIKMDIEGAWYEVVEDMIRTHIIPEILCVEFDSPTSLFKVISTIRRLRGVGLYCIHRDRDDYLFVSLNYLRS
ncbi:MAG: hypothetical protein QNK24_08090 [Desulfuromusa sp.]|nr:hypothetical protein [Desulfuromusa sp.]